MNKKNHTPSKSPYHDIGCRVSDVMTWGPITIPPQATLGDASRAMSIHGVHHLPVCTHDGRMVGIITERDLRSSLASALLPDDLEQLQREKLSELIEVVMTSDVCTATPDEPIGPAIRRLLDVRVGALPVVDDEGCLVGILSRSDVLAEAAGLFDSILTEVIGAELSRLQRSKSRQRREKAVS